MGPITAKQIEDHRERVRDLQEKMDRDKGRLDQLMTTLKKDFECGSLSNAKKQIEGWEKQVNKLEQQITNGLEEIETMFEEFDEE